MAGRASVEQGTYKRTVDVDTLPEVVATDDVEVPQISFDRWFSVSLVVGLLVLTILPVVWMTRGAQSDNLRKADAVKVSRARAAEALQARPAGAVPVVFSPAEEMERVKEVVLNWWKARTKEEIARWVREGQRSLASPERYRVPGYVSEKVKKEVMEGVSFMEDAGTSEAVTTIEGQPILLVNEGGEWKVDLEATFQLSEIPFSELRILPEVDRALVRCRMELSVEYSAKFPEGDFQAFALRNSLKEEPLYGYVRRGSAEEVQIRKAMNLDSTFFPPQQEIPARVRVSRGEDGRKDEFEIVEWVGSGWVSP